MPFHEEATFKRSKELPYDINRKDYDNPMLEFPTYDSTLLDHVHGENLIELSMIDEPVDMVDKPPAYKRRCAWY